MFLFDFLSKINAVSSFFKLVKSLNKVLLIIIFAMIFISITGFFIIKKHYDNSIYIDTVQDEQIKKEMQNIIKKCGNKYAIGVSVISTEINSNYYGKFKEFWACNENLNQECLMIDLTLQEKYRTDYNIDLDSYELFESIANEDEIKKLDLQTFNITKYSAIYDVLTLSPNFNDINTLWLSCVINNEKKVIYVISMTTWGDRDCPDAILYLTKLKQKLPISKLWK
jgi:hypothetical protein